MSITHELDGMGSVSNAFTTHEVTGYHIKAGKTYLDQSLDLLADIYKNSLLAPAEIERERQVIIEELHKDRDTPTLYIWWVWEKLLYGDQPAGLDVIGEEKTIRGLTQAQFVEYGSVLIDFPIVIEIEFAESREAIRGEFVVWPERVVAKELIDAEHLAIFIRQREPHEIRILQPRHFDLRVWNRMRAATQKIEHDAIDHGRHREDDIGIRCVR